MNIAEEILLASAFLGEMQELIKGLPKIVVKQDEDSAKRQKLDEDAIKPDRLLKSATYSKLKKYMKAYGCHLWSFES